MLFMTIFTYEPEKRSEVIKRRAEKGPMTGGKIIGEWSAIAGGKVFRVVEHDDPKAMLAAAMGWSDLGKAELIPIMTSEEVIKLASSKK
jgi:hypothetical protein